MTAKLTIEKFWERVDKNAPTPGLPYSIEDAAREYEAGATYKQLSAKYGHSIASIQKRLAKFGVKSRLGFNQFSKTAA